MTTLGVEAGKKFGSQAERNNEAPKGATGNKMSYRATDQSVVCCVLILQTYIQSSYIKLFL